ncbi:hypothetical protein A11A3_11743 [Alcanivorax hongdengensis A-11-3]|uniref:Thrombospondin type 3 repeat-containing protein n=1 Tax=Alcanivorax hongdengensis A-11-3 TaxID=1177179 RepID=L0WDN3_9GAMM|nr:thrombospondin type 3 repeat-containing protein [Alcanivorax hongdengensis]EKF73880.1 hypothetical protein A11A3_11743 [Alcanivorax hongdengensis A-11-3]
MKVTFRLAGLALAVTLAACGDSGSSSGGGDSGPTTKTGTALSGTAVKGPLANADVTVYQLDANASDGKGAEIAQGTTDSTAAFNGVVIPAGTQGPLLIEVQANSGTTDLTSGAAPVIRRLVSVADASVLAGGGQLYPTPLSTMVVKMALANADSSTGGFAGNGDDNVSAAEWQTALTVAQAKVKNTFGFGLLDNVDLLTTPPLITADTGDSNAQQQVLDYRTAVEGVAAIAQSLADEANGVAAGSTDTDTIFAALADDLSDGKVDGKAGDQTLDDFDNVANLSQSVEVSPGSLMIPGTRIRVDSVGQVLADETGDTGVQTDTTAVAQQTTTPAAAKTISDIDGDGIADDEDPDIDGDEVANGDDAFPVDASESADADADGIGDNADTDDDNDNVPDTQDAFPFDPQESADSDNDGVGDNADAFPNDANETTDSDGDGVGDNGDVFPNDPAESADSDEDGVGDNADAFPNDPNETIDSDNDGVGDNSDVFPNNPDESADSDEDGVGDNGDAFPTDPNESADSDNDGVGDNSDAFPNNPGESQDSDADGVGDNSDAFPQDPNESVDSDDDGVGDNSDVFPNDPSESADSDADGVGDNADAFPNDPSETMDSDNDGVGDNADAFPNDATESKDADGDGFGDNIADPDASDPCNPDNSVPACTGVSVQAVWDQFNWDQANWQ